MHWLAHAGRVPHQGRSQVIVVPFLNIQVLVALHAERPRFVQHRIQTRQVGLLLRILVGLRMSNWPAQMLLGLPKSYRSTSQSDPDNSRTSSDMPANVMDRPRCKSLTDWHTSIHSRMSRQMRGHLNHWLRYCRPLCKGLGVFLCVMTDQRLCLMVCDIWYIWHRRQWLCSVVWVGRVQVNTRKNTL